MSREAGAQLRSTASLTMFKRLAQRPTRDRHRTQGPAPSMFSYRTQGLDQSAISQMSAVLLGVQR
jgi:hypothetical protein